MKSIKWMLFGMTLLLVTFLIRCMLDGALYTDFIGIFGAIIVLYGIAALCGFTMAGNFTDLNVWAFWCLICAVLAAVSLVKMKR